MGEGIDGFISTKSGSTQVTVFIRGKISKQCQDELKMLISKWAEHCNLALDSVEVKLKEIKKK